MRADNELIMTALALQRGDIVRCHGGGDYHRHQVPISTPAGSIDRIMFIIQNRRHTDGKTDPQRDAAP